MEKKAIILNKVFEGSWNEEEGNISHEIIDYVLTDKGEHYIYNTPWGRCPDWIHIEGDKELGKQETHDVKYLLLTGKTHTDTQNNNEHSFDINYCIELEEKLHTYPKPKDEKKLKEIRDKIKEMCRCRHITYNWKYLDEIYKDDKSLLVTFKAKRIMKAIKPIKATLAYNFQRNKGYVKSDENKEDYLQLEDIICNYELWKELELTSIVDVSNSEQTEDAQKTFLDLILKSESEECYTNILFSILKQKDFINRFCKEFKGKEDVLNESAPFLVSREQGVVDGRMDVCADNGKQRIVIENKIYSGLNGIRKNESTQLTAYYKWASENRDQEPLCFITVPDYRIADIVQEILEKDFEMKGKYKIDGYSKIRDFIKKYIREIAEDYEYGKYVADFPTIFNQHSYRTKQEYYNNMFLKAIRDSENIN